jgi:O-antigen/teichoic acid export membrane protein
LFLVLPFPALVLRSVAGSIVTSVYLWLYRPIKVEWRLPWRDFVQLVKRGMRLYVSDYAHGVFWITVEIWLVYSFFGNVGVGLFGFSRIIVDTCVQAGSAVSQVFLPRLAQRYGETGKLRDCLRYSVKPTILSMAISLATIAATWILIKPVIVLAFPKYLDAVPLIRILILQTVFSAVVLPLYLLTLKEKYVLLLVAAIAALGVFVGISYYLRSIGGSIGSVAWGTLGGQAAYTVICLLAILGSARREAA